MKQLISKRLAHLLVVFSLSFAACTDFGKVEQGRAVSYDDKDRSFTMIVDTGLQGQPSIYEGIPPVRVALPVDENETGSPPSPGRLLQLDAKTGVMAYFDPATSSIKQATARVVSSESPVDAKDSRVYDSSTRKSLSFPIRGTSSATLTYYIPKSKTLLTLELTPEQFGLPPETWKLGDEVRVYFREKGKALRFMNVTKTDIFKK